MQTRSLASALGKGLVAGLAGTAAMTLSSTLEMKLQGRGSSDAPAQAAAKVLGLDLDAMDDDQKARLNNAMHWGYGTGWGAVRGLIDVAGLRGPVAGAAHFGAVWSAEQVMLPVLDVMPPITEWSAEAVAIDTTHHLVYAAATHLAYEWLTQR